jgi:hypothetical protein
LGCWLLNDLQVQACCTIQVRLCKSSGGQDTTKARMPHQRIRRTILSLSMKSLWRVCRRAGGTRCTAWLNLTANKCLSRELAVSPGDRQQVLGVGTRKQTSRCLHLVDRTGGDREISFHISTMEVYSYRYAERACICPQETDSSLTAGDRPRLAASDSCKILY